jgi:hypothetical protein
LLDVWGFAASILAYVNFGIHIFARQGG